MYRYSEQLPASGNLHTYRATRATRLWNELPWTLTDVNSFIFNFQAGLKSRA